MADRGVSMRMHRGAATHFCRRSQQQEKSEAQARGARSLREYNRVYRAPDIVIQVAVVDAAVGLDVPTRVGARVDANQRLLVVKTQLGQPEAI